MTVSLTDVRKTFVDAEGNSIPVLNVASFRLNKGEQVALVGDSGSGKSTLINVIAGILLPDSGKVQVDGTELTTLSEAARDRFRALRIGIVFQTFNLLPGFTALENVLLGMSFSGSRVNADRARQLLAQVGLSHRLHQMPSRLSVGEQQRVAVARALAKQPTVLLADEPTASVDAANQAKIVELIRDSCREQNCSLLLVTHSHEVISQFDRVIPLKEFNRVPAAPTQVAT